MKGRRTFLGLVGATILAGCSDSEGTDSESTPVDSATSVDTPESTQEPTPESTPAEEKTPRNTPTPEPEPLLHQTGWEKQVKSITVSGTIKNIDNPITVVLNIDGQTVESHTAGEFDLTADGVTPGMQNYTVAIQDDSLSGTVDVPEPMEVVEIRDIGGWGAEYNNKLQREYGAINIWTFDPLIIHNPNDEHYNQDFEVLHDGDVIDTFTMTEDNYVGGEEKYYGGPTYEDHPNSAYVQEYQFPLKRIDPFNPEEKITVRSQGTEASGTGDHFQKHRVSWSGDTNPRKQRGIELTGAIVDVTTPVINTHDADEIELLCEFGYFGIDSERGEDYLVENYSIPDTSVEHDLKVKMDVFTVHPGTLDVNSKAEVNYEPETTPDRGIYDVPDDHFRRVFVRELEDVNREEGQISYTMVVDNLYDAPASVTLMTCPHEYFPEKWPTKKFDIEVSADDDVKRIHFEHDYELDEIWPNYPGIYILQ